MSTFHGLELAKQALFAQQSALYTTGHNISNANTPGYSRQRVNFDAARPYPVPAMNRPQIPGQIGTGVEISAVQRIRDDFLDTQFRSEFSRMGHWDAKANALTRMERLLNEPSDTGLSKTMDMFWQSLQDLSVHPDQAGARSVVAERAKSVTDTFNHLAKSLDNIRGDLRSEIGNMEDKVNSLLRQINQINEQIKTIEPHGYLANDLYDSRDRLIDELSQLVNIKVTKHESDGRPLDIADGIVSIELVDERGQSFTEGGPIMLLDHQEEYGLNHTFIQIKDGEKGINQIVFHPDGEGNVFAADDLLENTVGALVGLISSYGYEKGEKLTGDYPNMMDQLDQLAFEFAMAFNAVHQEGFDYKKNPGGIFFDQLNDLDSENYSGAAKLITVSEDILKDPNLIAAGFAEDGEDKFIGNGENALRLAEVFDQGISSLKDRSPREQVQSMISELGINTQEAHRMRSNSGILLNQVDEQRMSVSAVSLDEEMSNMIRFQHAYNAAARNMTAIDEMIDRIINGMGLVGR